VAVDVERQIGRQWLSHPVDSISGTVWFFGSIGPNSHGQDFNFDFKSQNLAHAGYDVFSTPAGVFDNNGQSIGSVPLGFEEVKATDVEVELPINVGEPPIRFSDISARSGNAFDCIGRYFSILGEGFVDAIDGIIEWLDPTSDHHIHLRRASQTGNRIFRNAMIRLRETSHEQIAMTWTMGRLHIAWTGDDDNHRVNVLSSSTHAADDDKDIWASKVLLGTSNDDSGPAIVGVMGKVVVAWHNNDDLIQMIVGFDGRSFDRELPLIGPASEGAPALATNGHTLFLGYSIKDRSEPIIKYTIDDSWENWQSVVLAEKVGGDHGIALTYGDGRLYVGWTDTDEKLNILELIDDGSTLQVATKHTLNEFSSDDANPSLAYADKKLYIAWTDSNDRVNLAQVQRFDGSLIEKQTFDGKSHDDAGPAIVAASGGEVIVGWID
jgi:hypothetical protein